MDDACEVDEAIRNSDGMRGEVFIHEKRIPLRDVDHSSDYDRGQLSLFEDECDGMCGT